MSATASVPEGRLRLQRSTYLSSSQPYFRSTAEENNNSISIEVDGQWKRRRLTASLRGRDEYSAAEDWNYIILREIETGYQLSRGVSVHLGRKLYIWNEWEGDWGQGLYQPRYMQNKLRPESAGLSGVFVDVKNRNLAFTLGALANIPDLGAHFSVREHRFYSANPWFNPPADTFEYNSRLQDIRYSVVRPSAEQVIAKIGAASKIEWHKGDHTLRASYAYKPAPQFLLGFASRNQVVLGDDVDYMRVRIEPRLFYHRLGTLDYIHQAGLWRVSASITHENPVGDELPEGHTGQQSGKAWIYAASISRPLEEEGPSAARVYFGFLKVNGGDLADRGDLAGERTMFERRYQFNEAFLLSASKAFRGLTRYPLEARARFIYDRLQNGGAMSLNAGLSFSRSLRAELEMDMLGLFEREPKISDNFLSVYRANDRLGVGVSYAF